MDLLSKFEQKILSLFKTVPHLPESVRKWLGDNVWWLALIGAILSGISVLLTLTSLAWFGPVNGYILPGFATWQLIIGIVGVVFVGLQTVLLALSVQPLKLKQKKGWVLLFINWLVNAMYTVIGAVLTLNPILLIVNLIFGAIFLAISGYFLFEIHGQFAHTEKSKGAKTIKTDK